MKPRIFFLACLLPVVAFGQTSYWDCGGNSSLWGNADNWFPSQVPSSVNDVVFRQFADVFTVDLESNRTVDDLIFQGESAYTLSDATLTVGGGDITLWQPSSGSVINTISSNVVFPVAAKIAPAGSTTLVLSGTTTGSTLSKTNGGTVIFAGDASFSGDTTISNGILQIGNGGTNGTFSGNIINNATVTFNHNTLRTYTGNISGSGALIKSGSAGLQLTGTNTFTGGITLAGGNIEIGNGGSTGSVASAIANSGIVIFNRSTDYAHSAAITGSGGLYKVNSNTLTLTGTNSYSRSRRRRPTPAAPRSARGRCKLAMAGRLVRLAATSSTTEHSGLIDRTTVPTPE